MLSQNAPDLKSWTTDKLARQAFNAVVVRILIDGPTRVCVSKEGYCMTPVQAVEKHGPTIAPMIVYIRDDGWSLGTNSMYAAAAVKTWKETWVAVLLVERGVAPAMAPFVNGEIGPVWKDSE